MRRSLDFLYNAAGALAAVCVLAICIGMIGQSVFRLLGWRTGATNDVVGWLCAAAAFFAMAHTFKHGDFVRVTLLLEKLNDAQKRWFDIVSLALATLFVGYLAYWAARYAYESWLYKDMANGLWAVPMWIPQLSFVFGAALFFVAVLDEFIRVLAGHKPSYQVAVEERHAKGDFSSDV
jgi:TRAP-type C4-dicarboxylate transport system permease small subunit